MSIERAESDLARARTEVQRLRAQIDAASARVVKLEHYIEITRAYEAESGDEQPITRSAGALLIQACVDIIRARGVRQKTTVLVEELELRGLQIGGKNKVTNLSGALSRSEELTSNRSEGWGLAEWDSNDASQEARTSLISKQPDRQGPTTTTPDASIEDAPMPWDVRSDDDMEIPF